MRSLALMFVAGAAFGLAPLSPRFGVLLGATLSVALGVLLALAASWVPNALAVTAGAVGAFSSGVLIQAGPAVAGAVLVGAAFAERTWRVRGRDARIAHVGLALGAGALAGYLSLRFVGADWVVRSVVIGLCAVLALAPLLVPADDPLAFALDEIARDVPSPSADTLRAGADLRRQVDESVLDTDTAKDARRAWRNLLRLARARTRLGDKSTSAAAQRVARRLDQRLAQHVDSLTRMYTAVEARSAAELSLDDGPLESVESKGATLDDVSDAIVQDVA
ncbi:MAG: hypothetical protein R3B13_01455 [Polyangiaceae bacterium]